MQEVVPSVEQLTLEINFYLNQTAQNIIEVGKRLTQAKSQIPHGQWQIWLADNFNLTERTAQRFMKCADRFSKTTSMSDLNSTQMIELLALPEGETENFISEKKSAGTPVEEMTIKTLREEVAKFKADYETEKAKVENLFVKLEEERETHNKIRLSQTEQNARLMKKNAELAHQVQNPPVVEPADYRQLQKSKAELQDKIAKLEKNLAQKTVEVVPPADYETTKQELAKLQQLHSQTLESATVSQKLSAIALMTEDVVLSTSNAGILEYKRNFPDSFRKLCDFWGDFLKEYDYE